MDDRIQHAAYKPESLGTLTEAAVQPANGPAATGSQAMVILASSHRVVTQSGRLSGGRACALSARAASRDAARRQA